MNQKIEIINDEILFSSFFSLKRLTVNHTVDEASHKYQRELFARGDAVTVLPYDKETNKVLLTKQFRIGAHREESPFLLETVAGIVEQGEENSEVAIREAEEEAGIKLSELELITSCYPSPGACDEKIAIYLAEFDSSNYQEGEFGLDYENEFIETLLVDIQDLSKMISDGEIINGITIIAIQALLLKMK